MRSLRDLLLRQNLFDRASYVADYGADLAPGEDPLEHFLAVGLAQGRRPCPALDPLIESLLRPGLDPSAALLQRLEELASGAAVAAQPSISELMPPPRPAWLAEPDLPGQDRDDELNRAHSRRFSEPGAVRFEVDGRAYTLQAPPPGPVFEALRRCEPFAYAKLPHGFWDGLRMVEHLAGLLEQDERARALGPAQRFRLASRWAFELVPGNATFCENFLPELERLLSQRTPDPAFHVAIAFKGAPTWDDRVFGRFSERNPEQRRRLKLFARHFDPAEALWDGTLAKRWAISGALSELPGALAARPVILVGPDEFADLGERWGLPQFVHVAIPPKNSHLIRAALKDRCEAALAQCSGGGAPVLLTQCGGSLAFWLILQLWRSWPDAAFFDLGQALDIWVLDRAPHVRLWLGVYGRQIIENCGLESYYRRLGHPEVVAQFLA